VGPSRTKRKENNTKNPFRMPVLLSGTQQSNYKTRQAKASPRNPLCAWAQAERVTAAGCEGSPGAGGRAGSLLASPRTRAEEASGATLPPAWVFAVPMAQAAEPRFPRRLGRFTAEAGLYFTLQ